MNNNVELCSDWLFQCGSMLSSALIGCFIVRLISAHFSHSRKETQGGKYICLTVCHFHVQNSYYSIGVSPTKDFHSRIGIFESCRYSTDSRIISLGAVQNTLPRVKSDSHNY